MSLEYSKIIEEIVEKDANKLEEFLKKKYFSEGQLIQILKRTFNLHDSGDKLATRTGVGKLIYLFSFIENLDLKNIDSVTFEAFIKRLMSSNGEETFNEILCHQGLTHLFNSYSLYPLFSDAPDGRVGISEPYVNVEIKSRFSQLIDRLTNFYFKISELLPILDDYDLVCTMEITKLNKKLNDQTIEEELKFLAENVNIDSICDKKFQRTTECLEYKMSFSCSISEKIPFVYFTQGHVENCIFSTVTSKYLGPSKSCGKTTFTVILDPTVKETYSNSIIKDCLDRIKNMPDEPRCIVIYSNLLGDIYLKEFFKEVSRNYVNRKPATAIVGITGHFLERTEENKIGIDVFAVGNDIKEILKTNSNYPNRLE